MHADKAIQNVHNLDLDELLRLEILPNKDDLLPAKKSGSHLSSHDKQDRTEMKEKVADGLGTSDGDESEEDESELEMHKEDLERLKETDPEFYKYLKDTDKELLEFDDEDGSDEMEADQLVEGQDDGMEAELREAPPLIDSEYLSSWCESAEKNASLGAIKYLCRVYRAACHHGDGDAEESLELVSSAVYNRIMLFMLQKADGIFRKALNMENTDETIDLKAKSRWPKVEPFVKSFLGNTLHLLGMLSLIYLIIYFSSSLKQVGSSQIHGYAWCHHTLWSRREPRAITKACQENRFAYAYLIV